MAIPVPGFLAHFLRFTLSATGLIVAALILQFTRFLFDLFRSFTQVGGSGFTGSRRQREGSQ
jgi:hypothetical protein